MVEIPSTSCQSAAAWALLNKNQALEPASGHAATCVRAPFVESCPWDAAPVRALLLLEVRLGGADGGLLGPGVEGQMRGSTVWPLGLGLLLLRKLLANSLESFFLRKLQI